MARSPLSVTSFNDQAPAAPWLLALHGVSAHGLRFVRLAALLAGIRVVAPDLRGHGRSPKEPPFSVARHVADLLPLLEIASSPPVVVGHSFGGLVAWELARAAPASVDGLVLVDPAIGVTAAVADEGRREALTDRRWPNHAAALAQLSAGRSEAAAWSLSLDVAVALERDGDGRLRQIARPEALVAAWDEMGAPLSASDYRGPTLLIEAAPEEGRYVSPALVEGLRVQLGERLEHVAIDSPHTVPADRPELLADLLGGFLRALG